MTAPATYTVGVDFGTLSARAVVVRVRDGAEMGSALYEYPHGVVDEVLPATGQALPPDWALQMPGDWRDSLRTAVPAALHEAGVDPRDVIGIGTDFTACTVMPTLRDGTPLCELPDLADRPHSYPKLWKHHAAQPEADQINELAHQRGESWIGRYGGKISSEWEFAKALQVLHEDPDLYTRIERWIEAADWIIWQLCGSETRNICTAGYKGIYQDGRRPSRDYLAALDPGFGDFVDDKLEHPLAQLGTMAGTLTPRAAAWTGLPEGIAVAVGNVDAHVTSAAAQALEPGQMLAVMGTSTCHIMNSDVLAQVPGMCGVVRDGVVPGLWGYEAGQSGVGDIFAWFLETGVPGEYIQAATQNDENLHDHLTRMAAQQEVGEHGLVALDWHSGNRSILVDHHLSGVVAGLTLATRPEHVYRALLESTAFGTRKIVETFAASGVPVKEYVVAGGLVKNKFLMQIYSDVTRLPISTVRSDQGPALGSAIHAAVAAGAYPDIFAASAAMGGKEEAAFTPDDQRAAAYDGLYEQYAQMHDFFGRDSQVLHNLRDIRDKASPVK